jgi:uncharacterized protein (TIGR03435 family)
MQAITPQHGVMSRLLLPIAVSTAVAFSQTEASPVRSEFEVASIKPNLGIAGEAYLQAVPGRLRMQNIALRPLIQLAWGVEAYQVSGGPSWIGSDRFDIEAKAAGSPSIRQMQGPMLQALLEDRFKLAVHRETKQMPVYEIRLLNGSGKMQPSTAGSCIPYRQDAPPPPAPEPGQPRPFFATIPASGAKAETGRWMGKASMLPPWRQPWRGRSSAGL